MDALLVRIAERITSGADPLLSPSEALELARLPESATLDILSVAGLARAARKPAAAFTCGIINAKSGRCPENCAFCAQSAHHQTDSPVYPLYDTDTLLRRAEELAGAQGAHHQLPLRHPDPPGQDHPQAPPEPPGAVYLRPPGKALPTAPGIGRRPEDRRPFHAPEEKGVPQQFQLAGAPHRLHDGTPSILYHLRQFGIISLLCAKVNRPHSMGLKGR